MNERLKILRVYLELNQSEFAERIGIKQAGISAIENGIRNVTDRVIADICREFSVNENWIRTGEGEMFATVNDDLIEQLAERYEMSVLDKTIVTEFVKLKAEHRKIVTDFLSSVHMKQNEEKVIPENDITLKITARDGESEIKLTHEQKKALEKAVEESKYDNNDDLI